MTAFLVCATNACGKELVPFSVHSPSCLGMCLVFLLTQTNKRLITHLGNKVYRKQSWNNFRSNFSVVSTVSVVSCLCSVQCIWRPAGKQGLEKPANNTCSQNTTNIWNSSLVAKPMLTFISLQMNYYPLACVSVQCWQCIWT